MSSVKNTVESVGSNITGNLNTAVNDIALIMGDPKKGLNNIGGTLGRAALRANPVSFLANPNDLKSLTGETGSERLASEKVQEAKDEAQNLADIKAEESMNAIKSVIAGVTSQRMSAPGVRAQTLLGSVPQTNTLLNIMSKK
jgi:hypothetical protein